jgi:hypothetical protein
MAAFAASGVSFGQIYSWTINLYFSYLTMSEHDTFNDHDDLTIYVNGTEHQLLKKIVGKDQLLKLVDLDPKDNEIFLLDDRGGKVAIDNDEGVQLQGGMRFLTQHR